MHFPEIQPRKSLYYNYEIYPYFHSNKNTLAESDTVTVVGAGPIGMATALLLAKKALRLFYCPLNSSYLKVVAPWCTPNVLWKFYKQQVLLIVS